MWIGSLRREGSEISGSLDDEVFGAGKYRPVIDRSYTLDEVVEATRYMEIGQKTGNVVPRVSEVAAGRAA